MVPLTVRRWALHSAQILLNRRAFLLGLFTVGLGLLLGGLLNSPQSEGTVAIVGILVFLVVIVNRPMDGLWLWLILDPFLEDRLNIDLGAGIPDLSLSRFCMAFLFTLMLAQAVVGKRKFAPLTKAEAAITFFIAGLLLAVPNSVSPTAEVQRIITRYLTPLVVYVLAKNLVQNRDDLQRVFVALIIVSTYSGLYAMYEISTGNILFLPKGVDASELFVTYSEHLHILRGLLGMAPFFARVFSMIIPVNFYLLLEAKNLRNRLIYAITLVIGFIGLFLSYNRTMWIATPVALLILLPFYPRFRRLFVVILLASALMLFAAWDQINDSAVVTERVNSKTSTLETRTKIWNTAISMWAEKPLFGHGFGQYARHSGQYRTDGSSRDFQAIESDYLDILVSSGLAGFAPYVALLLLMLRDSIRLFRRARLSDWTGFVTPVIIAIFWAVFASYAIGSYTITLVTFFPKMIFFLVAGAIVGTHEWHLHKVPGQQQVAT